MSEVVTGRSGFDADGNLVVYQPPGMVLVQPATVSYGEWQTMQSNDTLSAPGIYEIAQGSGELRVGQGSVTYRIVTVGGQR